MIESIAGSGSAGQTRTTRTGSNRDDGFASTLSAVSRTETASSSTAAATATAPSAILGSPGWFNQLFASPAEEQVFASDLTQRLQAAGVDTSNPIALTVDSSGHVKAKDDTPAAKAIDALFAGDPTLENTYKKIANTEETTALARTEVAFSAAYGAAGNDAMRGAVWQLYSGNFDAITADAGNLTLSDRTLKSTA